MFYSRLLCVLITVLFCVPAWARDYQAQGPIPLRSQNPLYLLFLTPRPERAVTVPHRHLRLAARGPYSNLFEQGNDPGTGVSLDLDMEVFRPSFLLQYSFAPGWELGLELPLLHFEGGFLDAFVQDFHRAFGFPNAGRERVRNGRFSYAVTQGGNTLYRVDDQPLGLSDMIVHVKKEFLEEGRSWPAVAGTFYLKFPTGDRGEAMGSGMPDLGMNVALEKNYKRIHGYANLGTFLLGATTIGLEPYLNSFLWTWMVAFEVTAWEPHLSVIAQLQGDGSLFDGTGVGSLDRGNLILTIGFAGQEGPWGWKAGFAEDPSGSGPAVDFTTYFEVSYTWGL